MVGLPTWDLGGGERACQAWRCRSPRRAASRAAAGPARSGGGKWGTFEADCAKASRAAAQRRRGA
eukprot:3362649-Pleurochrysis_carterae.AAC.1